MADNAHCELETKKMDKLPLVKTPTDITVRVREGMLRVTVETSYSC